MMKSICGVILAHAEQECDRNENGQRERGPDQQEPGLHAAPIVRVGIVGIEGSAALRAATFGPILE